MEDCIFSTHSKIKCTTTTCKITQLCPILCDPVAPLSVGFSRQEYWNGLPFPSPGNHPDPGFEPGLPHCRQTLYVLSYQRILLSVRQRKGK